MRTPEKLIKYPKYPVLLHSLNSNKYSLSCRLLELSEMHLALEYTSPSSLPYFIYCLLSTTQLFSFWEDVTMHYRNLTNQNRKALFEMIFLLALCLVTEKAGQTYPDSLSGSVRQFTHFTSGVTVGRKDQPWGLCLAETSLIDKEVAEKVAGHCSHQYRHRKLTVFLRILFPILLPGEKGKRKIKRKSQTPKSYSTM